MDQGGNVNLNENLMWIKNNPKTTAAGVVAAIAAIIGAIWPDSPWPEAIVGAAAALGLVLARDGDVGERRAITGRQRGGQSGRRRRRKPQQDGPLSAPLFDVRTIEEEE